MRYAVFSVLLALAFALPVLADDPPPPADSGGWEQGGEFQSPTPPPPDLPEPPPSLQESGTVQEWGGPYRFYVPPGQYVLEADPILPRGSRLGGVPQGDIGRALDIRPEGLTPANVFYVPTSEPPEFEKDVPGQEYVLITNPETGEALRFKSRDEAVYYMGENVIEYYEKMRVTVPGLGEVPWAGYFTEGTLNTTYYCSVADCVSLQQMKAEQAAQEWQEFVEAVENFVQEVIDWIKSVVDAIVDWFVSLFGGG
jgi:hypothetical protein